LCAVVANVSAVSDPPFARQLGHVSTLLSICGFVIALILGIVVGAILASNYLTGTHDTSDRSTTTTATPPAACRYNSYQSSCYRYNTFVGSSGSCDYGVKSPVGNCYSNYCPNHAYGGSCYKYKTPIGSDGTCSGGIRSYDYCYTATCPHYKYYSYCYTYRSYVGIDGTCSGRKSDGYCYSMSCMDHTYSGICYKYKEYVGRTGNCTGVRGYAYYCYYTYCPSHVHEYRGSCFKYRKYVGITGYCSGVKAFSGGYCYYTSCPGSVHRGSCYGNREFVGKGSCAGVKSGYFCFSDRYE